MNLSAREHLIVFVKAPRPGLVKTRVAESVGADAACMVYTCLADCLFVWLRTVPEIELRFTPDDAAGEIQRWMRPGWTAVPQGPGDLGERLDRAFAEAFRRGAQCVVVIGSDCPDVRTADVRDGWQSLQTHDVVLGSATDGGYWLIGLRAPQPDLFRGIAWSSSAVLYETTARARAAGLTVHQLRELGDVDTIEDWQRYLARVASEPPT